MFIPKREAFNRSEFGRRQDVTLGEDDHARYYAVASAEDIILRKLDGYKMGGEFSERQWLNVLGILKLNSSALDFVYMKKWAADLVISDLLDKAMEEAGLLPVEDIEF